jgi:hypothetical protein
MTTVLPIPSGPTNREIIDRAYKAMGAGARGFGLPAEDYADAVDVLSSMMLESPFDLLGYVQQDGGEGNRVEDESGIARKYLEPVALMLAERIAPTIGKTLAPHTLAAKRRAYSLLCAAVVTIPDAKYQDGTPRGLGHRVQNGFGLGPFFVDGE